MFSLKLAELFGRSRSRKHRTPVAKRFTTSMAIQHLEKLENRSMLSGVLGTAESFAVLGGSTVTNTGPSTVTGNLGLYPGTSIPGLADITINGTVHQTDAVAQNAGNASAVVANPAGGFMLNGDADGNVFQNMDRVQVNYTSWINSFASERCHHRVRRSRGPSGQLHFDGTGFGRPDADPGRLQIRHIGPVDGSADSRRSGRPRCRVHLPDWERDHDRQQLVGERDQWRSQLQRVLADWQLRDSRHGHGVRRESHRAGEHHLEYSCQYRFRSSFSA